MYPLSWLGLLLLTSLRMTRAVPVASHGLPCTHPPIWVWVSVRALLRMAPCEPTSNCWYWLRDTPARLGVVMLTCGVPLAEVTTVGRCSAGALGSAMMRPALGDCCAESGCTTPTQPSASHSAKLIGRSVATLLPPRASQPPRGALTSSEATCMTPNVRLKTRR